MQVPRLILLTIFRLKILLFLQAGKRKNKPFRQTPITGLTIHAKPAG
jgi:hypothetical protein